MFEDKSIDPRECTYCLLSTSKLRKQIQRLINRKKLEFGLIKSKSDPVDFYSQFSTDNKVATSRNLMNRVKNRSRSNKKDIDDNQTDEDNTGGINRNEGQDYSTKIQQERMISKIQKVESILNRSDKDQKQTFTYDDLIELHRLLQHLDDGDHMDIAREYFYVFLEDNFRVMRLPERRQNASLEERLRKLKFKAASNDYDSMVANVAHYVVGNNRFGTRFTNTVEEFRQIRSTLLVTINAIMVIVATFFFFYCTIGYAKPEFDTGKVVLYSFGASMVVAMAEIYFLIRII